MYVRTYSNCSEIHSMYIRTYIRTQEHLRVRTLGLVLKEIKALSTIVLVYFCGMNCKARFSFTHWPVLVSAAQPLLWRACA